MSVGTALELTGIPTLARYLVARKTKLEQNRRIQNLERIIFLFNFYNQNENQDEIYIVEEVCSSSTEM